MISILLIDVSKRWRFASNDLITLDTCRPLLLLLYCLCCGPKIISLANGGNICGRVFMSSKCFHTFMFDGIQFIDCNFVDFSRNYESMWLVFYSGKLTCII